MFEKCAFLFRLQIRIDARFHLEKGQLAVATTTSDLLLFFFFVLLTDDFRIKQDECQTKKNYL